VGFTFLVSARALVAFFGLAAAALTATFFATTFFAAGLVAVLVVDLVVAVALIDVAALGLGAGFFAGSFEVRGFLAFTATSGTSFFLGAGLVFCTELVMLPQRKMIEYLFDSCRWPIKLDFTRPALW
jgi:hypothetical protein